MSRKQRKAEKHKQRAEAKKNRALEKPPSTPTAVVAEQPKIELPHTEPYPDQGRSGAKQPKEITTTRIERLQLYCNYAIAIATAVGAVGGIYQWSATRDQYNAMIEQNAGAVKQSEQTDRQIAQTQEMLKNSRLEYRAWLGIVDAKMDTFTEGYPASATVAIENTGATPGLVVAAEADFDILKNEQEVSAYRGMSRRRPKPGEPVRADVGELVYLEADTSGNRLQIIPVHSSAVPPSGTKAVKFRGINKLTKAEIDGINAGTRPMLIVGHVAYKDAFGQEHQTRWWLRYDATTKKFYGDENGNEMN